VRRVVVVIATAVLGGCGGTGHGHATLWVTRDRGATVLLVRRVPAGLTAMQALSREARVETRYGGRFVQAIDGVASSSGHDWFYYVNGYLAGRGATEYRLHDGDVEWWDYRSWATPGQDEVVVGAFPEPFLHGYAGKRRPAVVVGPKTSARRMLTRLLHARRRAPHANVLVLRPGTPERFYARAAAPGKPVTFVYVGDPMKLARNPQLARFRYALP
jgi:hypothetical protein